MKKSLGEIGTGLIGLTYSPSDVVEKGGIIVFRSSNIQNGAISYDDIVRVNKTVKESIKTQKGDLLICARNGSARLIGKNALLSEQDVGQTFGAFMLVYRSDENPFVHKLLNTKRYTTQVSENLGARINQITTSNLNDFEFYFPGAKSERNKIADFLSLIDQRIETQIGAIEDLKVLMRGVTQSVIKDKGTKKIMLGDILTERTEKNTARYDVYSVAVNEGIVNQIEHLGRSFAASDTSHYNVVHHGDIVYTKSPTGDFPYGIVKRSDVDGCVAVSPLYGVYEPASDLIAIYLHHYFESATSANNYLHKLIQKGAKNTINISNQRFLENYLPIPSQATLVNYCNVIGALEKKLKIENLLLEAYRQQKVYLLQNMFV